MSKIEVYEVTKVCQGRTVLNGVSLSLDEGSCYGLAGANGSGKSTLMKIIATLERPTSGRLLISGKDPHDAVREVRKVIGYVGEEFTPQHGLTVVEHLAFLATCCGLKRAEADVVVHSLTQLLDLTIWKDTAVESLSKGLRRRLAFASALVNNPEILLLDDPFESFGDRGREEMLEVLAELKDMGKTIVVATRDVAEVETLCDAIGVLSDGMLAAMRRPSEFGGTATVLEELVTEQGLGQMQEHGL